MITIVALLLLSVLNGVLCISAGPPPEFAFRQCEPIRFDMCRGIGYNETAMPNLFGHELQTEAESILLTFAPLIEYVCSTQLKLFLCAAYVPMCTPKVPVPIGPCRSLCESVRSRCHPVLQGFGFPWPPALDCSRFPKENNHETMCMEGPGEAPIIENEVYPGLPAGGKIPPTIQQIPPLECPGLGYKSHLYVKLHRRCAPKCDADILFEPYEKHLAEVWVATWTYAALGLAVVATLCLILSDDSKTSSKWSRMLTPLVWCHDMVAIGLTIRFVSGRTATSCGYDPQLPNVSLLLVDGLSNVYCAATFLLRYYFGMAACAWWAILCLGWHREVRRHSPDAQGHIALGGAAASTYDKNETDGTKRKRIGGNAKRDYNVTHSNLARFAAWGLPAFQTAAVIVARLVDADELLGACFVGNQSDKGLQILVATPLFCYWIFGSMNLISGYLVHRRNKEILQNTNSPSLQHQLLAKRTNSGSGTFLFIYCAPYALLLLAVIYEFANIDIWLNSPRYVTAPLWPFLTRVFMELMLGIICFAWVLGPKISTMYRRQLPRPAPIKQTTISPSIGQQQQHGLIAGSSRTSNKAYSTLSYQTVRQQHPKLHTTPIHSSHHSSASGGGGGGGGGVGAMSMNQMSNYSFGRSKCVVTPPTHMFVNHCPYKQASFNRYGNETIL